MNAIIEYSLSWEPPPVRTFSIPKVLYTPVVTCGENPGTYPSVAKQPDLTPGHPRVYAQHMLWEHPDTCPIIGDMFMCLQWVRAGEEVLPFGTRVLQTIYPKTTLGIPGYVPDHEQNHQIWHPGTPEYNTKLIIPLQRFSGCLVLIVYMVCGVFQGLRDVRSWGEFAAVTRGEKGQYIGSHPRDGYAKPWTSLGRLFGAWGDDWWMNE